MAAWAQLSFGNFTLIDLIAATTYAFSAALLVQRPSHFRQFTVVGILLLAVLGGITGGVIRDVLLNAIPAAIENPAYLVLCLLAGAIALVVYRRGSEAFRNGLLRFMTAFSLPWFAVVGAEKALQDHLPYIDAVLTGVVAATAGRYAVDLTCGVTPMHFVRAEWFVGTALLATVLYVVCSQGLHLTIWPATLISVGVAFIFRLLALLRGWEEPAW